MDQKIKTILRWIAVLPASLISGFLMTFPLHWILYLAFGGGTLLGFIETLAGSYVPVEHALSPFVIALTFVLVGSHIAPKYKFKTALILSILWITLWFTLFTFSSAQFEPRGILSLMGSLLGLFIAWKISKKEPGAALTREEYSDIQKTDTFNEILRFVYSSKRAMPAHFCSTEDRSQTFMIDSELLDAKSDLVMASQVWGMAGDSSFGNYKEELPELTTLQYGVVVHVAEDMMLASFFATKMNAHDLMDSLKKEILENDMEDFKKVPDLGLVLSASTSHKYFEYCIEYGKKVALGE